MLWRRLYDREGVIKTYYFVVLAVQRQVNEMEIRAGPPETVFLDLPEFLSEDEGEGDGHYCAVVLGDGVAQNNRPLEGGQQANLGLERS